jgi:hypothetical protein
MPLLLVNSALADSQTTGPGRDSAATLLMPPCGINPEPEWALDRAGLPREDGPAYTYPDTQTPVRLYLIDTSVANPGDWIGANPNLTLERTVLVRGVNDPQTFTTDHGTKMLSLIGDPETGIAPGTPIHVVNYDVFPTGQTTDLSLLASAVYEAISDVRNNPVKMRSAICIATSTTQITADFVMELAINDAIADGIPVIVSAGNLGKEILGSGESYLPAAYGTQNGVICVGASNDADTLIPMSNFGAAVDLLAPGNAVRVRTNNEAVPFATMTGTSPATALVAGAVLTELSLDSSLTPAEVEERLKTAAFTPPSLPQASPPPDSPPQPAPPAPKPVLRATVAAIQAIEMAESIPPFLEYAGFLGGDSSWFEGFIATPDVDSNGNGLPDIIEEFFGFNAQFFPVSPTFTPVAGSKAEYRFPISKDQLQEASPFELRNGMRWRIQCSGNMIDWDVPEGSLNQEEDESGRIWLTATFDAPPTACFVRIQVAAPAPAN